jgi:hypothetical protein
MFGKSVAGDVRFLKQRKSGDSSAGELMPLRIADGMQAHFRDEMSEQRAQRGFVGQRGGITRVRFDDPFTAAVVHWISLERTAMVA